MKATALLSTDGAYRWCLGREWGPGPICTFVMLNPATADAKDDDPTIRRCLGFAKRFGCGTLEVVNLFGLRATDPKELLTHPDPVGEANDTFLKRAILDNGGPIVAAWGATPFARDRARRIVADYGDLMHCLGRTKDGSPKHPLYVPGDQDLVELTDPVEDVL